MVDRAAHEQTVTLVERATGRVLTGDGWSDDLASALALTPAEAEAWIRRFACEAGGVVTARPAPARAVA